jgi:hypothetical protein
VTKAIATVAPAPAKAATASSRFLCADRSATAPTTGSTSTVSSTDTETRYGK